MRRRTLILAAGAVLAGLTAAVSAKAEVPEGTRELGLAYEYGTSFKWTPVQHDDRDYYLVALHWASEFKGLGGGHYWWFFEPRAGSFEDPLPGVILGADAGLRWYPWTRGRLLFHLEAGAGALYTWFPLLYSHFNFNLYPGAGLSFFLTPRLSLDLGYRLDHISNGGLRLPNVGLNSHMFTYGASWRF